MTDKIETQGPYYLIEVINRRNGIQYGTKWIKQKPRRIKEPKQPKPPARKG